MADKLIKVFVYGTLKRGEPNHHWLTNVANGFSRFLTTAKTNQKLPLVIGTRYNIPFLLDKRGVGHQIQGEVYEVDEAMFAKLDVLEAYPEFYDREIQTVTTETAESLDCWLYLIRKYPEKLLAKEHLVAYHDSAEQAYCERSQRKENIRAADDMAF